MFLENGFKGKNHWGLYLAMSLIVLFFAPGIGSIPLFIAVSVFSLKTGNASSLDSGNVLDLSNTGIPPNLGFALVMFTFVVSFLVFGLLIKPFHKRTLKQTITAYSGIRWKHVAIGATGWFLLLAIATAIYFLVSPGNVHFTFHDTQFGVLILLALVFVPIQTGFEEVFFRGYLMQGFAVATRNKWAPILITSVIFGLVHSFNPEVTEYGMGIMMPQYIFIGLMYGILTVMDDGIELAWGAHFANNFFLALFVTHKSDVIQTPALFTLKTVDPVVDLIVTAFISIAFIFIASKMAKWGKAGYVFKKIDVR